MHCLLFVWICVFVASPATGHWVHLNNMMYTVYSTKLDLVDLVTSMERCEDKDAKLASFQPSYNFTKLISILQLETNTIYWLAVGKLDELFKTCFALSILKHRNSWRLRNINCSVKKGFICEREPTPSDLKHHIELPISSVPIDGQISPTKQSSITTSPVCISKTECRNPTLYATLHAIEPSFSRDLIHPRTTLPYPIQYISGTELAPHSISIFKTNHVTATETTESIRATKPLPASAFPEFTITGNKVHLCSVCHERCPSYNTDIGRDNGTDNVTEVDVLNVSLVIDVKDTNRYRRQLTSAHDPRPSSRAMGVAAVIVIATVMLCIMAMDLPHVLHNIHVLTGGQICRRG